MGMEMGMVFIVILLATDAVISLDPFAMRQFDESRRSHPSFINYDPQAFTQKINEVPSPSFRVHL